jgi:hypothetical protein
MGLGSRSSGASPRRHAWRMVWQANHPFPPAMNVDNLLCGFGCGRPAINVLKSGKPVCAGSVNQCPVMRERNSAGLRGKNPFHDRPHPRGMAGKAAWNRGLTWEEMFGAVEAQRMHACCRSVQHPGSAECAAFDARG